MNNIFNSFSHFTIVYIDDVLVYFNSIDEHWKHLYTCLDIIKHNGIVVSAKKIKLFQTKVRFLGWHFWRTDCPIDKAIQFADKFPNVIIDKTQLQRFLGFLNYISEFYKDLRKQCKPFFDRLQKKILLPSLILILLLLNKSSLMLKLFLVLVSLLLMLSKLLKLMPLTLVKEVFWNNSFH